METTSVGLKYEQWEEIGKQVKRIRRLMLTTEENGNPLEALDALVVYLHDLSYHCYPERSGPLVDVFWDTIEHEKIRESYQKTKKESGE